MSFSLMSYRLFRLRRLIVFTLIPPLMIVLILYALKGPAALVFLLFAIGAPIAHILRYPNSWMETVAVSLTTTVLIGLAGTIGPEVGLIGLAFRIFGLALLAVVLFFIFANRVPSWFDFGEARPFTARTSRFTKLDAETVKDAVTLYPGRQDDKVICGQPDEDGVFPITFKHQMQVMDLGFEVETPEGEDLGIADDGSFDLELFGVVMSSTPELHELISIMPDTEETTMTRFHFKPKRRGTKVIREERGVPMTRGYAFGFWLQDYIADYLTDEVDRAEGRTPRANRFQTQDQLIVSMAEAFFAIFKGARPAE